MTIHNVAQWRAHVALDVGAPFCSLLKPLSPEDKASRMTEIGQLTVPGPSFNAIQEALDLHMLGRTPGSAAPALIQGISGPASVGKSTATTHHARLYEIRRRRERNLRPITDSTLTRDLKGGAAYVPVVRVTAQSGPIQTLNAVIQFFGLAPLPNGRSSPRDQITRLFEQCQTEVIYVEQFNAFQGSTAGAAAVSEQLKFLSEATSGLAMVIVGIDLEHEVLRVNSRSTAVVAQLFDRLSIQTMAHPDPLSSAGRAEYLDLLATWEERLPLLNKEPGDLTTNADLIADSTDGAKTARLASLIRGSARLAILDGQERILPRHIATSSNTTRTSALTVAAQSPPRSAPRTTRKALSAP